MWWLEASIAIGCFALGLGCGIWACGPPLVQPEPKPLTWEQFRGTCGGQGHGRHYGDEDETL